MRVSNLVSVSIKSISNLFYRRVFSTIQTKLSTSYFPLRILSTFFCLFRSCAVTSELSIQTLPQQLCAYPPPVYPFLDTPRGALEVLTATRVVAKFPHSPPFTYLVPASGIALQRFGQPLIRRRWCLRLTNCQRRQRQRRRQRRRRRRLRR